MSDTLTKAHIVEAVAEANGYIRKKSSEIFINSRYWQVSDRRESVKFGANFEHIINFTEI